jgi:arylsulfatase A
MYAGRTSEEQEYFGAITQMDEQYGRLLNHLDEEGLAENTIVIFSSDNGCTSPVLPWVRLSRGRSAHLGSKHNIKEGGIRVPGVVRWPGVTQPASISHVPVSTLELLPTLCAAAGASLPGGVTFDGGDFRQALRGGQVERPHPLYWQFEQAVKTGKEHGPHVGSLPLAMRDGPWKLMCDLDFRHPALYNLDTDPVEQWNMIDLYPSIAERIMKRLREVYADVNGPYSTTADTLNPYLLQQGARERYHPQPVP